MEDLTFKLINVFKELRASSKSITDDPRPTIKKYDMLFLGSKFNTVYTNEMYHVLENYFHISMENEDFQNVVPTICNALDMKYSPMQKVEDSSNSTPYCYQVELW